MFFILQTVQTQMKCQIMQHFTWDFTVCQITYWHVSRIKRVKWFFHAVAQNISQTNPFVLEKNNLISNNNNKIKIIFLSTA